MQEIWRKIVKYENYQVSNKGRIRRKLKDKRCSQYKYLSTFENSKGYVRVQLCKDSIPKWFFVHRLVANAFIEEIKEGLEVNHKDGNKKNNWAENLEIVTSVDNLNHAEKVLGKNFRVKPRKQVPDKIVEQIKELTHLGHSQRTIAEMLKINRSTVVRHQKRQKESEC